MHFTLKNEEKIDGIVYHYCSPAVFKTIVEKKTIRLADITESNDSKEIVWNNEFIKEYFASKINGFCRKHKLRQEKKAHLFEMFSNAFASLFVELNYKAYVCCFSYKEDQLSQWRGYADDAEGYAIGFDLEELKRIGSPKKEENSISDLFELGDVVYDLKEQRKIIKSTANALFALLSTYASRGEYDEDIALGTINTFLLFLFQNCVFFKNDFFAEEKEWRLCFLTSPDANIKSLPIPKGYSFSQLSYFLRDGKLVSYFDLSFENHPEIIKRVVAGPKNQSHSIDHFAKKNGLSCEIVKSKGTYR